MRTTDLPAPTHLAWWRRALFALAVRCRWGTAGERQQAHRFAAHVGTPRGAALLRADLVEAGEAPLSLAGLTALVDAIALRATHQGGVLLPRRDASLALRELRAWLDVRLALIGKPPR